MGKEKTDIISLLDCTIRDGGYVNNWGFDKKMVREIYRALSKAGVDYVELGYHGTEKYFDPKNYGLFRFSSPEDIAFVCQGINGAAVSLMVDHGKYSVEDLKPYVGSQVKLIRLAFHKDKIREAMESAQAISDLGFKVSVNLMGFSSYTGSEKQEVLKILGNTRVDYAYVADTYGSMFPDQVAAFYKQLLELKHIKWGFHPHNNLQMGFANSLMALSAGARIIDSSVFGMGRGAGNLPTEIILSYLQQSRPEKYNVIPVLNLIDRYFVDLHRKYGWGYDLPYMISGIYGCHPDYAKNLVDRREYDIEEIWNILGVIKGRDPIGFKKELVDEILKKGLFGKKERPSSSPPVNNHSQRKVQPAYLNRHPGADFLIVANGPSIKQYQGQINAFISKYKPVVMGGNFLGGLFKPDYHAFSNKRRFMDYIGTVDKDSLLLVGEHLPPELIREYTDRAYETIYYEEGQDAPFDLKNGVISSNCRTIALLLMGVAILMGAKRIFAVGLDGYMNLSGKEPLHFYNEKNEAEEREVLLDRHLGNLKYLKEIDQYLVKQGKEGVHLLTPSDYTEYYKGLDNYL